VNRFALRGPLFTKRTAGRARPDVDVDPVLAAILGVVLIGGGGLAAYGATQDTAPAAAPAPVVQNDDPVVARALAIVARADGTSTTGEPGSPADAKRRAARAEAASRKGRSVDPFGAPASAGAGATSSAASASTGSAGSASTVGGSSSSASSAGGSSSGGSSSSSSSGGSSATPTTSSTLSAAELARRAAAAAAATNAAIDAGSGGTASASPTGSAALAAQTAAARRRAVATRPARISLRIKTEEGRSARSKRSLGLLVPSRSEAVARVVAVSSSNRVVTLRLRSGAALTGKQSKGTKCTQRLSGGDCRLVRVRTGRTAVIRAPRAADGTPGAVTALRILTVWRGGVKVAG
jgi:hypothetical protein